MLFVNLKVRCYSCFEQLDNKSYKQISASFILWSFYAASDPTAIPALSFTKLCSSADSI